MKSAVDRESCLFTVPSEVLDPHAERTADAIRYVDRLASNLCGDVARGADLDAMVPNALELEHALARIAPLMSSYPSDGPAMNMLAIESRAAILFGRSALRDYARKARPTRFQRALNAVRNVPELVVASGQRLMTPRRSSTRPEVVDAQVAKQMRRIY